MTCCRARACLQLIETDWVRVVLALLYAIVAFLVGVAVMLWYYRRPPRIESVNQVCCMGHRPIEGHERRAIARAETTGGPRQFSVQPRAPSPAQPTLDRLCAPTIAKMRRAWQH